jgi:hypothetical protein
LIGSEKDELRDQNMWIGDSGATCHMSNQLNVMFDIEEIDQALILGDGRKLKATKEGKIQVLVKDANGKDIFFNVEEVKCVRYQCLLQIPKQQTGIYQYSRLMNLCCESNIT